VSLSGGGFQVTANHTYTTPGTYTITTTVTDDGGQTTSFTSTATIAGPGSVQSLSRDGRLCRENATPGCAALGPGLQLLTDHLSHSRESCRCLAPYLSPSVS
jgi:hypothetical protein